ncbi:MAG: tetratricopeptide repeat protein [Pyrinomonadaceae bacterium]|nr:tetratricopeptide repeat protein [Pyrinomonadaceae bacterium]
MSERIEIFKQMLEADPSNHMVLFGLANEYIKEGNHSKAVQTLEEYISKAEDEGAAYGMMAKSYEALGENDKAKKAYEQGIEVALGHGHPSMAEEYKNILDSDFH